MLNTQSMTKHPRNLILENVFGYTVVVIKSSLRAPTYVEGRIDIDAAPIHDLGELMPIRNVFEVKQFDGRPGDYESVILLSTNVLEGAVELRQVVLRSVGWGIGLCIYEVDLDLQRSIAEQTKQLRFGDVLDGHEV